MDFVTSPAIPGASVIESPPSTYYDSLGAPIIVTDQAGAVPDQGIIRSWLDKIFGAPPRPAPGQEVINATPPTPEQGYQNLKDNLVKNVPVLKDVGAALNQAGTVGKWVVVGVVALAVIVLVVQVKKAF